jgi:hypothetical protein
MSSLLNSDEFIIIKDDSCQLIHGSPPKVSLSPSSLYLTNRRVYIEPRFQGKARAQVALASISSTEETIQNDILVLKLKGQPLVSVFIPDNENQHSFGELILKLAAAAKNSETDCDALSLSLQRRFIECQQSLREFYRLFHANKNHLVNGPPTDVPHPGSFQEGGAMQAVEFLCDMITFSEYFPLGLIVTLVCILSLVFYFIPFGVVFCGAIFMAMMKIGFSLIFSKTPWRNEDGMAMKGAVTCETGSIRVYETFRDAFRKRFLWRNPRHTLETAVFLLSTAAMFAFCDPAFVLGISLVGLAFIERWNPFGYGSISEIFSALFSF